MNMQDEAAGALTGQRPMPPPQQGQQPQPAPGAQAGSLGELAQAFQRCEQTHQCTPQDRATLEAGLPKLVQMAKMIQQILQASQGGGQPPPQGQAPAPQPQPQPGQ